MSPTGITLVPACWGTLEARQEAETRAIAPPQLCWYVRAEPVPKYLYDPGEGRFKHRWKNDYPGFEGPPHAPVGKCPSDLKPDQAQQLLDDGFPYYDDPSAAGSPEAIYNVFKGVPYEAAPTERGKSFHGYPWRGKMPKRILQQLEARAENEGFGRQFRDWIDQNKSQ